MLPFLWADYRKQPYEVSVETQALCNAACTFCPYPTLERIGTRMPDELLDKIVREMAAFPKLFKFSPFKVNEPFLDKRVIPLCEKVNRDVPKARLRLFSNGSALTDKTLDGVARLERVEHLWISLNEHDPEKYRATMGLDFAHTTRNLDRLHARDFPHPVCVSRVGHDAEFIHYVQERWPKFTAACIKRDAWIDYTNPDVAEAPATPCTRWWELNITATGKAARCCMDATGEWGIGDANTQTLLEIYNEPMVKEWRDKMMVRQKAGYPCSTCSY